MTEEPARIHRIVVHERPAPITPITREALCALGHHRWAWLTNGRMACGYCGKPA